MTRNKKFNAVDWMQKQWRGQGYVQCAWENLSPGAMVRLITDKDAHVQGVVQSATRASIIVEGVAYSKRQIQRGFKYVKV